MKPEHELALEEIRSDQVSLHRWMRRVDDRIESLADALARAAEPEPEPEPEPSAPEPVQAPARGRAEEPVPQPAFSDDPVPVEVARTEPPREAPVAGATETFAPIAFKRETRDAPLRRVRPEVEDPAESMEITLGRVWLVRLGVVILLTGLVFLGNLAYEHIIPMLGAGAKLAIVYLAGFALAGLGLALERNRESLRNYARVVFAGGCATIYYATYAAHFVAPLRVIESPLVGGTLLLGLAIGIGVAAHRRKSETLALIALVLSYYTSGLNPIGHFTLFSSFLLAGTAIFFLLRHRWVRLTTASLVGAYLSYVWCRFQGGASVAAGAGVFAPVAFLSGYWILFTAGGFLASREALSGVARAQLLTANNGAFAALGALEIVARRPDGAWVFALIFGLVLLGLGRLARKVVPDGSAVDGAFCIQGLALTTLGMALKLTGQQFALVLAAQSVVALAGSGRIPLLRLCASLLSAAGAAGLAGIGLANGLEHASAVAACVAIALVAVGWIFRRRTDVSADEVTPVAFALVSVALFLGVGAAWRPAGWPQISGWLAGAAIVLALIPRRLGLRELTLAGQALLPAAAAIWVVGHASIPVGSSIEPVLVIVAGIALSLWWARQSRISVDLATRDTLEAAPAFAGAVVTIIWAILVLPAAGLLIAASVGGAAWIGGAVALRARYLTAAGFGFSFFAFFQFTLHHGSVHWGVALLPIAHMLLIAGMASFSRRFGPETAGFCRSVASVALGIASIMAVLWTFAHIDREWQALVFALAGAVSSMIGAHRRQQNFSFTGAGLAAFAWLLAVIIYQSEPTWQHLAAITLFPAASRLARRLWNEEPTRDFAHYLTWASMAGITLWALRWCDLHAHSTSITIIWTLLALAFFSAGLLLRDRHYRLGGLGLLAVSIGRVFFVDVWALEPVLRILSFIILGTVLLVVGYCYNRFEEKLRRWL